MNFEHPYIEHQTHDSNSNILTSKDDQVQNIAVPRNYSLREKMAMECLPLCQTPHTTTRSMAREKMAMECLPLCQTPHTTTRSMAGPRFCRNYVYLSGYFQRPVLPVLGKGSQTVCVYLEAGSAGSGKGVTDIQTNAINIVDVLF